MTIRAVIFNLDGVLVEVDWERYREDQRSEIMSESLQPYEQLNEQMLQLLKRLRPHYKLAVISRKSSREAVNRRFGLGSLIDLMVFDNEEGASQSGIQMYQLTLTQFGLQPEEAVCVDNKTEYVDAARDLGSHAIHFQHTHQTIAELEKTLRT